MATTISPSNTSGPSKQSIFTSGRPSTSSLAGYSPNNYSQGIGYSPPTPTSPASSGIPSFRSLRSLLPFGSNKNATSTTTSITTTTSVSTSSPITRSPFGAFSSVRRSMTKDRERKVSLSIDPPVIAIEKSNGDPFPDDAPVIRRSVSLSKLDKPLPSEPTPKDLSSTSLGDNLLHSCTYLYLLYSHTWGFLILSIIGEKIAFTLRTPSPGPALSAELSTIIEADNSGVSKHITTNSSPTTNANVIVIDGDEHPDMADTTFNMESIDRDLADLLNPHSVPKQVPSSALRSSPTPPNFPTSHASRLPRARQTSSLLPRPRSSNSPSIPQSPIHHTHTPPPLKPSPSIVSSYDGQRPASSPVPTFPSTSTPVASQRNMTVNHSPRLISPSSSSSRAAAAKVFGKQQPRSATPTRTLRQAMLGDRDIESPRPTPVGLSWNSLDSRCASATENGAIGLGRPMSRGASFDSRTRPAFTRSSTSPERTIEIIPTDVDSSPDIPFQEYRPSLDSNITTTRPSFDGVIISRPSSAALPFRDRDRDLDGQQTPSLRVVDPTAARDSRASPVPRIPANPPSSRTRKRSMSVQDSRFVGRNRGVTTANEDLLVRSGSSLSIYGNKSRGGGGMENGSNMNESSITSSGPRMEWLGPRTAKAFRAAGLMDFDYREKERDGREEGNNESTTTERLLRDRSGSTSGGILSPSPLGVGNPSSTVNRFTSLRSASEYNPTYGRSHSRLTSSSEAGSGAPRRGSESYYNYGGASSHGGGGSGGGGGSYNGLMESPTFTVSSGSRDRDTPKSSISTGPTSLADSFGYLGRDRDRDRERELEMMREMKEKHGTEMGALLGALSDSQRTVRVLREENSDLRDRLERFTAAIQTNQELRRVCEGLQSECGSLRKENTDLRKELVGLKGLPRGGGNSSGVRTPVPKTAHNSTSGSPLGRSFTRVALKQEYDNTFIDHGSEVENHIAEHGTSSPEISVLASPSSKKRRLSNSSSIFPIPASNMTLLLHEDVTSTLGSIASCSRSSIGNEHSQYGFSFSPPPSIRAAAASSATSSQRIKTHVRSISHSPPVSYHDFIGNIPPNSSVVSIGSISPSMITGSPGSLFLRPEHEILLGDMESLDLGARGDEGDIVDDNVEAW